MDDDERREPPRGEREVQFLEAVKEEAAKRPLVALGAVFLAGFLVSRTLGCRGEGEKEKAA